MRRTVQPEQWFTAAVRLDRITYKCTGSAQSAELCQIPADNSWSAFTVTITKKCISENSKQFCVRNSPMANSVLSSS